MPTARRSVLVVRAGTSPCDAVLDGDDVAVVVDFGVAVGDVRDENAPGCWNPELEALVARAEFVFR
jgi:hypothetical protein